MILQIPLAFLRERSGESGSVRSYQSPLHVGALNVLYGRSPSLSPSLAHVPGINDCNGPRGAGTEALTFKYLSAAEKATCALDAS